MNDEDYKTPRPRLSIDTQYHDMAVFDVEKSSHLPSKALLRENLIKFRTKNEEFKDKRKKSWA